MVVVVRRSSAARAGSLSRAGDRRAIQISVDACRARSFRASPDSRSSSSVIGSQTESSIGGPGSFNQPSGGTLRALVLDQLATGLPRRAITTSSPGLDLREQPRQVRLGVVDVHRGRSRVTALGHVDASVDVRWSRSRGCSPPWPPLTVFVIAAVVVGREAHRLDAVAPRVVYRIDEAVDFVADHVPPATQARLTPAEVEQLLVFHLRWLHAKGLQPVDVTDRRQDIVDADRDRRGQRRRLPPR